MGLPSAFGMLCRSADALRREAREHRIVTTVVDVVARETGLTPSQLRGRAVAKRSQMALHRSAAVTLSVLAGDLNKREVARQFGIGRHAVIDMVRTIDRKRSADAALDRRLDELELRILDELNQGVVA